MPIIVNETDLKMAQKEGWTQLTVADAAVIGALAMVAYRRLFEAEAKGPKLIQGDMDQLLYVIRGNLLLIFCDDVAKW